MDVDYFLPKDRAGAKRLYSRSTKATLYCLGCVADAFWTQTHLIVSAIYNLYNVFVHRDNFQQFNSSSWAVTVMLLRSGYKHLDQGHSPPGSVPITPQTRPLSWSWTGVNVQVLFKMGRGSTWKMTLWWLGVWAQGTAILSFTGWHTLAQDILWRVVLISYRLKADG